MVAAVDGGFFAQLDVAKALFAAGATARARDAFEHAARQGAPNDRDVLIAFATFAVRLGHEAMAEQALQAALRHEHAYDGPVLKRILDVALWLTSPALAESVYQHLVRTGTAGGGDYIAFGQLMMRQGQKQRAFGYFEHALADTELRPASRFRVLHHIAESIIAASAVGADDAALLSRLLDKAGDIFHPRLPDVLRALGEKSKAYAAAVAAADPGPLSLNQTLARIEERLGPLAAARDVLAGAAPPGLSADVAALVARMPQLGHDAKTDLDIWTACLALAPAHNGADALAGKNDPAPAMLLAGILYALRKAHREALVCLALAIAGGLDHWLVLWRALVAAAALGYADVSLALARAVYGRCPDFNFAENVWKHPLGYYAQDEQDVAIEAIFDVLPARERFFVEVGGFDPTLFSNTRRLSDAGWHGLIVEPSPDAAARLREAAAPGVTIAEIAASHGDGMTKLHEAQWPGLEGGGGLSSLHQGQVAHGMWRLPPATAHDPHLGPRRPGSGLMLGSVAPVTVRTMRLDDILIQHGMGERAIDLLNIDVETAEPFVLQGFNLEARAPRVIMAGAADIYFART